VKARHRRVLERRRLYLESQIAIRLGDNEPCSWEQAEVAALSHALAVLEDADAIGLTRLGRLTVAERDRLRRLLETAAVAS